jgi:hypothetical protein
MNELTLRQRYAALPSWRRPHGESIATPEERRAREHRSMCSAILDIVGSSALTRDQIASGLRDDIGHALRILMRDGDLRRCNDCYEAVYDWHHASGDAVCEVCGLDYYSHSTVRGYPWLHRTCAGRLVKL